jgi:hypothetical protein
MGFYDSILIDTRYFLDSTALRESEYNRGEMPDAGNSHVRGWAGGSWQ